MLGTRTSNGVAGARVFLVSRGPQPRRLLLKAPLFDLAFVARLFERRLQPCTLALNRLLTADACRLSFQHVDVAAPPGQLGAEPPVVLEREIVDVAAEIRDVL